MALTSGDVPRGVYLHSSPGRGKTLLAGLLSDDNVRRFHFHDLMLDVHRSLHRLRKERDPVAAVADELSASTRLLYVDELEVSDIADASLLKRLHEALLQRSVSFLFTSNAAPETLYRGGLNAGVFQPAFASRVRATCDVLCLDAPGAADYRARADGSATSFYLLHKARALTAWELVGEEREERVDVPGAGRFVSVPRACGRAARFSFAQLCGSAGAMSSADYAALLQRFDTLLVEDVPASRLWGEGAGESDDELRRFVNLVDLAYDSQPRTLLILAGVDAPLPAAAPARLPEPAPAEENSAIFVTGEGGSSGRSTTMMAPGIEWSATGRSGASLAGLAGGGSFARRALPRTLSRLQSMMGADWASIPGRSEDGRRLAASLVAGDAT